jgi:hypothetical protein
MKLFYIYLILEINFIKIIYGDNICTVVINEINFDNPELHDTREFIEIKFIPKSINSECIAENLAVAIIKGNNKNSGPTIDFLASVKNKRWPIGEDGYYVIGNSETVINVDNDLYSEHVYTKTSCNNPRKSRACSTRSIVDFFPNGNTYPEMVILFRTSSEGQVLFNNLKPTAHHDRYLNGRGRLILKNVLLDAVVYARKITYTHCSIFEDLVDSFKMLHSNKQHYVLIDLETPQNRDNTINRCTELISSYVPEYFKIGSPTPGNENDCTGPNFVISVLLNKNMSRINYSAPGNINTVAKSKFYSNNIQDTCSSTREVWKECSC